MQSSSPCCLHPLFPAGCPRPFEGFVCHHWHTQLCVPPSSLVWDTTPVPHFSLHIPVLLLHWLILQLIFLPLVTSILCLCLSCFIELFGWWLFLFSFSLLFNSDISIIIQLRVRWLPRLPKVGSGAINCPEVVDSRLPHRAGQWEKNTGSCTQRFWGKTRISGSTRSSLVILS